MNHAEELELLERCRRGEYDCFEKIVGEHERKIYNLALRMLGAF